MALWDKVRQGIDKAGKAAQDVFDEGKLRLEAYRAREQADKAAEALGYALFRAIEAGGELDADARSRLLEAVKDRDAEARRHENALAEAKARMDDPPEAPPPPPPSGAPDAPAPAPATPPPATSAAEPPPSAPF
ncbi:hypothetical protein [Gemmatimonas sp.]|jgi:hypothetical protein|uniref:hypothetical protein n=1 Tax=Gemmatimonas sp. TaxID=1962908 RepID=UPI002636490A|nr:hypothetical protein [Gemmatimonas sp.]